MKYENSFIQSQQLYNLVFVIDIHVLHTIVVDEMRLQLSWLQSLQTNEGGILLMKNRTHSFIAEVWKKKVLVQVLFQKY